MWRCDRKDFGVFNSRDMGASCIGWDRRRVLKKNTWKDFFHLASSGIVGRSDCSRSYVADMAVHLVLILQHW